MASITLIALRAVPTVKTTHGFHADHVNKNSSIETISHNNGGVIIVCMCMVD